MRIARVEFAALGIFGVSIAALLALAVYGNDLKYTPTRQVHWDGRAPQDEVLDSRFKDMRIRFRVRFGSIDPTGVILQTAPAQKGLWFELKKANGNVALNAKVKYNPDVFGEPVRSYPVKYSIGPHEWHFIEADVSRSGAIRFKHNGTIADTAIRIDHMEDFEITRLERPPGIHGEIEDVSVDYTLYRESGSAAFFLFAARLLLSALALAAAIWLLRSYERGEQSALAMQHP